MRYESFYPFFQGQNQPSAQSFSTPQNRFFGGPNTNPNPNPYGLGNVGAPMPNQSPFSRGGRGGGGQGQGQGQFPFGFGGGAPNQSPYGIGGGGSLPNRLEQYMQTADRFLSTAQQLTPMVNKVAPMVQNIPALWKIYRGFQNMPNAGTTSNVGNINAAASAAAARLPSNGTSQPRIFQPPI